MKILYSLLLFLITLHSEAQTTVLSTLSPTYRSIYKYQAFSNGKMLLFTGSDNNFADIWSVDLQSGTNSLLVDNLIYCQSLQFNSSGAFYVSFEYDQNGNDGKHFINYLSENGTTKKSQAINYYSKSNYRIPYSSIIINNKYYIMSYFQNRYCIWEYDGIANGAKQIFSDTLQIIGLQEWKGSLFFVTISATQYNLYTIDNTTTKAKIFKKFDQKDFGSSFSSIGSNDSGFYFSAYNSLLKESSIWRTNLSEEGTIKYIDKKNSNKINFYGDYFLFSSEFYSNEFELYKGLINNPDSIWRIQFSDKINSPNTYIEKVFDEGYLITNSIGFGRELGKCSDSVSLISDLAPGPLSSLANIKNNVYKDSGDRFYIIATNASSNNYYFYRSNKDSLQSLFPVESGNILDFFTYNNFLIWFNISSDSLLIFHRNLNAIEAPQPTVKKEKKEEWHRQLLFYNNEHSTPINYNSNLIYPTKVFSDDEENVITGLAYNDNALSKSLVSSDTSTITPLKGGLIFTKHNKYGELQWVNSIGSSGGNYYASSKFTVDKDGNPIVFGIFSRKAYFDSDSLNVAGSSFFVAKLDGKNGKVLWKKMFNSKNYSNSIFADAITCDPYGNIYLALMYKDFNFSIDGFSLNADVSPANAIIKLSPDGKVLLAKNMLTPWIDYYGNTYSLEWNNIKKQIISIQCQGSYRTSSSCKYINWRYFIQQINVQGEIENTYQFNSDDLGAIGASTMTKTGLLYLSGFYRGTLETGNGTYQTNKEGSCNRMENFSMIWQPSSNDVQSTRVSNNNTFYPFDAVADNEFIYVLGADRIGSNIKQQISLRKYDHYGKLLAKRKLNEYTKVFDFGYFYFMAVKNEHLILTGFNFSDTIQYNTYTNNEIPYLSILKLNKNEGWQETFEYPTKAKEVKVFVSPNPSDGDINLTFLETNVYNLAEVFDVKGSLLYSKNLNGGKYETIDISTLAPAVYILRLSGNQNVYSIKIVKQSK